MEPYLGEIRLFAGSYAPLYWKFCDGSLLPIARNEPLFSLIGTTFGGDGVNNFGLPDLRGRVPVNMGAGPGLSARTVGQTGGSEMAALTPDQLPAHTHPLCATTANATTNEPSPAVVLGQMTDGSWFYARTDVTPPPSQVTMNAGVVSNSGGGGSHDNMMCTMGLNYIICLQGIYPTKPA